MTPQPTITIIGAGVIGLSTATLLQTKYPNAKITIVAAEFPVSPPPPSSQSGRDVSNQTIAQHLQKVSADYASMWAGAHYRPIPGSSAQNTREREMCFRTARKMKEIASIYPEAGVELMPAEEYLEDVPEANTLLTSGDQYAGPDDEFTIIDPKDLPAGVRWGCRYRAYTINVHVYCHWLLQNFQSRGGLIECRTLQNLEEELSSPTTKSPNDSFRTKLVINCSGRNFDLDPKTKIIRGQTVLVRNVYHRTVTRQNRDGTWSFLIPRPLQGGTVVGGTKEIDDMETKPRKEIRRKLLDDAVRNFPNFVDEVGKFEVVMDNVGRRPFREGGMRIEIERRMGRGDIVHGYGAGGRGYELSWGAAEDIVTLASTLLGTGDGLGRSKL